MKPQTLAKLDLLATAKEATLLETLARHNQTLRQYEAQRAVLDAYQARLMAGWQGGATVTAGGATRAAKFASQAQAARVHLAQAIKTEQDKQAECAVALATLRTHRETLQERLKIAQRVATRQIQDRAERNNPALHKPALADHTLF